MSRRKLTQQQRQRIRRLREQRRRRALKKLEQTVQVKDAPRLGRVIVRHGQNLLVRDEQGADHHCLLRQNLDEAACGDNVLWQPTTGTQGVIIDILPRKTVLTREDYSGRLKPLAANITQLIVVLAPKPEPTGYLTDQYLVAAESIGVQALIVLNKSDLLSAPHWQAFQKRFTHYRSIGYPVIATNAQQVDGLSALKPHLQNQTSILVGQSGVGKSSLINALLPEQQEAVGALSQSTGLGRHTTSIAKLHVLPEGGEIIDSPGVRSFRLGKISRQQLEWGFVEFRPYLGQCRFSNCTHRNEPGCALQQAVKQGTIFPARLENFLHMAANLEQAR